MGAFMALDTDKDGEVSKEELRQGLLRLNATTDNLDEVFEELDVGSTGAISYTEFLAGVIDLKSKKSEEQDKFLFTAWQQFSPDARGMVNHAAVQNALASRG